MTEKGKNKKKPKNEGGFPFGLGDIAELAIHLLVLKPIMWISALLFETASYYYHGGCNDCHERKSLLNQLSPDAFNMLWNFFGKKEEKEKK